MPLDVDELEPTTRNDYRRANGAPMVVIDGRNERYSRPSSFAKPLDDESALVNWKIDRGCIGVAYDRALQAAFVAVALDDKEGLKVLREKAINAGRGAEKADIGTALHAMSVRFEVDLSFSPPQPYLDSLQAYMDVLTKYGLRSFLTEYHTVNREYRCAGTADRLYELSMPLVTPDGTVLPVGTLLVGDLKTGEKLEYSKPAYAVQLALYADGECYDVLTDQFLPTPLVNREWAIVVHMPADHPGLCELLWVDLEVGRLGCWLVQQIKLWRKMWRSNEYAMPQIKLPEYDMAALLTETPPPCWCERPDDDAVVHRTDGPCFMRDTILDGDGDSQAQPTPVSQPESPSPPPTGHLVRERGKLDRFVDDEPFPPGAVCSVPDEPVVDAVDPANDSPPVDDRLTDYTEYAKERLAQIAANAPAKKRLLTIWPTGLPTPKQGFTNMVEVDTVMVLLSQIEAEFQLGFVPMPASILGTGPSTHRRGK